MLQHIHKIHSIDGLKLIVEFDGVEQRLINFEHPLREWASTPDSIYHQLLNPAYFKNVKIYDEWKTLYWDNGIDFSPETFYALSQSIWSNAD